MTDKSKPISGSNPPESRGIRTTVGYQPTEPGKPTNPPVGGTNVQAHLSKKSLDEPKKVTKTVKKDE